MSTQILPEKFSELQPFVARWDLPGTAERYASRLAGPMEELEAFYHAVRPRIAEIRDELDKKPIEELDDAERSLGRLVFAWVPVAEAVEVFHQPRVPDSKGYWTVRSEGDL